MLISTKVVQQKLKEQAYQQKVTHLCRYLPDLLSRFFRLVDGAGMQRSRMSGCLTGGLVELEL